MNRKGLEGYVPKCRQTLPQVGQVVFEEAAGTDSLDSAHSSPPPAHSVMLKVVGTFTDTSPVYGFKVIAYHSRAPSRELLQGVLCQANRQRGTPLQLIAFSQCLNIGGLGLGEDAHVGMSILSMDLQDFVKAALVVTLQGFEVPAIHGPRTNFMSDKKDNTALKIIMGGEKVGQKGTMLILFNPLINRILSPSTLNMVKDSASISFKRRAPKIRNPLRERTLFIK
eukprot:g32478.t1